MIDVFWASCALDGLRATMSCVSLAVWEQTPGINLIELNLTEPFESNIPGFQTWHRAQAERRASSSLYIVAEDDCLPLGTDFVRKAVDIMNRHPEFGLLAFRPYCHPPVTCHMGMVALDSEVYEDSAPGGISLIRTGILKPRGSWFDNAAQAKQIQDKGFRTGRFLEIWMHHLGECFSTVTPKRSGYTQPRNP